MLLKTLQHRPVGKAGKTHGGGVDENRRSKVRTLEDRGSIKQESKVR
jgi:hypothetical protein